jgi:APA family basic amino acid/polyamine antiporter
VFGTIISVGAIYCLASLALVSMQPFEDISATNGFGFAFEANNLPIVASLAVSGELLSLPVVVLISFIAQPRIQYALAVDGLLPSLFREIDGRGNLTKGILVSGAICTLIALLVPFQSLDDMIR